MIGKRFVNLIPEMKELSNDREKVRHLNPEMKELSNYRERVSQLIPENERAE